MRGQLHWYSELFLWEGPKRRCKAVPQARCDLDELIHYTETLRHHIGAEMFFSPCLLRHNVFSYLPSECLLSPCLIISWSMCLLWPLESGGKACGDSVHDCSLHIQFISHVRIGHKSHWFHMAFTCNVFFHPTLWSVLFTGVHLYPIYEKKDKDKTKSTTLKK